MPVIPTHRLPLWGSQLSLDISGVAGFFGGDVAVSAMATVHIYQGRRWLGWYNMPGSYEIAKRYGQLAGRSRFWSGLYPNPGTTVEPAALFELDGKSGPRYRAMHSGTDMKSTGHPAHLFLQECKSIPHEQFTPPPGARDTTPIDVTIVNLHHVPPYKAHPRIFTLMTLYSIFPILASTAACVACAVAGEWICLSMILLGVLCSGTSCLVIGSGDLTFTHPKPADNAPPADGFLDGGSHFVVLHGEEGAVNSITRGTFSVSYASAPKYHNIGASSLLLTVQFLAQLLLVPQGRVFGQIMFLCSLAVSWMYNSYLSSLDKESIQRRLLCEDILKLEPQHMRKYKLGTRTSMAVFVTLVLASSLKTKGEEGKDKTPMEQPRRHEEAMKETLRRILDGLLPKTGVWPSWKDVITREICDAISHDTPPTFLSTAEQEATFDQKFLESLYRDARTAYATYSAYHKATSETTEEQDEDKDPDALKTMV